MFIGSLSSRVDTRCCDSEATWCFVTNQMSPLSGRREAALESGWGMKGSEPLGTGQSIQSHTRLLCPWNFPGKNTEWVAISFSKGSSTPGIEPVSLMSRTTAGGFFTISTTWEALVYAC